MINKYLILSESEPALINKYREFLNTSWRQNESELIMIYVSKCDILDKPNNPAVDDTFTDIVEKINIDSTTWDYQDKINCDREVGETEHNVKIIKEYKNYHDR
jgi:hypothetical protein